MLTTALRAELRHIIPTEVGLRIAEELEMRIDLTLDVVAHVSSAFRSQYTVNTTQC